MAGSVYDIAIIGGGINGCGIARDAAGRGLSVFLCEMNDLASGTSSWSTKLIHGGLRYLEYYEFRLVHEALAEREVLWAIAPHIIQPLRFVLPHHDGLRPAWLLRLGLFLYDHLGGRKKLRSTRTLDLRRDEAGKPLQQGRYRVGFEYSDCAVDDARLVILNARDAADRGADIRTRTRAVEARQRDGLWQLVLEDGRSGERSIISAKVLINAAGPWVHHVLADEIGIKARADVRLVQGSHIVVRRLYEHDRAYIFQNADGRIVFAIPYQGDYTLIGTTDRDYHGDPAKVRATAEEVAYLCAAVNDYFARPVRPDDVVWSYSGVRPLYDDGATDAKAATREYMFELDASGGAAVLSIFGGKITTYRRLAEHALERISPYLPDALVRAGWTAQMPLPGGDFAAPAFDTQVETLLRGYPFLERSLAVRLTHAYGTQARAVLGDARGPDDLGRMFGSSLSEREVRYLIANEWARTAEDVAWRRSKLGLRLSPAELDVLQEWMQGVLRASGDRRLEH